MERGKEGGAVPLILRGQSHYEEPWSLGDTSAKSTLG